MKKGIISIGVILLLCFLIIYFRSPKRGVKKEFEDLSIVYDVDITNYYVSECKLLNVLDNSSFASEIATIEEAKKQAIRGWSLVFDEDRTYEHIKVSYDSSENIWLIEEAIPIGWYGGGRHIIIRENGDVLAVWSDK